MSEETSQPDIIEGGDNQEHPTAIEEQPTVKENVEETANTEETTESTNVENTETANVEATETANVEATESTNVEATETANVEATESTNVETTETANVEAEEPTKQTTEDTEEPKTVEAISEATSAVRTKYYSIEVNDPVELAIGKEGITAIKPITIIEMFKDVVQKYSNAVAYAYNEEGVWKYVTYAQYYDLSVAVAKSFLKLELEPFHSVGIIGFNSPEWFLSAIGAIMAGGISTGIYATNKPDVCKFVLEDSKADIVVVEDDKQLQKILSIKDQLPSLKAIVQYRGKLVQEYPDVYEWAKFIELGANIDTQVIEKKVAELNPACCASLIYTSGTVGFPKGVMLSHDNVTWTCRSFADTVDGLQPMKEKVVSFLPLSHIAAQLLDIYLMMYLGGATYFAEPDALKGSLGVTLRDVRPTIFVAVPRVWEKFMEAAKNAAPPAGSMKHKIASWAKGVGYKGNMNIQNKSSVPWGWTIANALVFNKVKESFGFTEAKLIATTAAPARREILDFFMSINIPLIEVYGMSEATGPVTTNLIRAGLWKVGTIGWPVSGVEVKLHEKNDNGEGELCYRGRNVMMGYHNNIEKTMESLDSEGWLHSGDLAVVDKDGFYTITGRKKELLITSGGENIAPIPIENNIKSELPFVSNVMAIGDKRHFLTCLITLKCEMNTDTGEPTDNLTPEAINMIAAKGSTATKISQVIDNQDPAVFTAIEEGIQRANTRAVSNAATVKKWSLLDTDFSEPGGELGPTQKLKRFYVLQKYADTIDGLYAQ